MKGGGYRLSTGQPLPIGLVTKLCFVTQAGPALLGDVEPAGQSMPVLAASWPAKRSLARLRFQAELGNEKSGVQLVDDRQQVISIHRRNIAAAPHGLDRRPPLGRPGQPPN